jgi:hypothetical protein
MWKPNTSSPLIEMKVPSPKIVIDPKFAGSRNQLLGEAVAQQAWGYFETHVALQSVR